MRKLPLQVTWLPRRCRRGAICFAIFFLFVHVGFGQDSVLRISQIQDEGVLLDKGWRFQAGDNLCYADPKHDDSEWRYLNPAQDIHDLPQLWSTPVGWFRLRILLDSTALNKVWNLVVEQTGASEIYLNGQRIANFGKIVAAPADVKAVSPVENTFVHLPFKQYGPQLLAVRFALQRDVHYISFAGRPNMALYLRVQDTESISAAMFDNIVGYFEWTRFGIFLLLSLLHLALFLFAPEQRANLYYFFYAACSAATPLLINLVYRYTSSVTIKMQIFAVGLFAFHVAFIFILLAVYTTFRRRISWLLWVFAVSAFAAYYLFGARPNISIWLVTLLTFLPLFEVSRVVILAAKAGQRGAGIVVIAAVIYITCLVLATFFAFGLLPAGPNFIYGHFAYNIAFVSIPIGLSFYLALEASYTSHKLAEKLLEVKTLSAEKQQLLASENERLEQQVTQRTAQLEQSLEELKAAQQQLIQQEKMASLGELTAGIAHEIQNPLNFVNNFSETNRELLSEMKEALDQKNYEEAKAIADDIENNEAKINHHGKRADGIVKSMLQHSRASAGEKLPVDINALADEYLRLSYQTMRSKDKFFHSAIETNFDNNIGKINVVPQDIGRVLLNLFQNAFYAVHEKKSRLDETFEPVVYVSTEQQNGNVIIIVKDNGTGIPADAVDKILQPFFTTKPTGQGTGLGLSLSYDIIKAHGGEIKVESKEGEYSRFIIQFPNQ